MMLDKIPYWQPYFRYSHLDTCDLQYNFVLDTSIHAEVSSLIRLHGKHI